MRINKDRLLAEFLSLTTIDSKSFHEEKMGAYIKRRLNALGLSVFEDDAAGRIGGNCGNIYGYWKGNGSSSLDPVLFCSHMDTVEPCEGKQAIVGDDGFIRSDGRTILGADDGTGIAAILEALTVLKEQDLPHRPIEVLFTVAEEVYCKGASCFDCSRLLSKEAYVLDLAGPVGSAAYKAPSILSLDIAVIGKASHAGFAPEKGIHAIQAASKAIAGLTLGHVDDETTLNIGLIRGGLATNIVPERCTVAGEIRSYSHQKALRTAEIVREQFEEAVHESGAKLLFEVHTHCEAYETPVDHAVAQRFENACRELKLPFHLQKTFGGSDNHHLAKYGINGLVLANAMNDCHSCQESTSVEELCRIGELTLSLMLSDDK